MIAKLKHLQKTGLEHEVLELKAEILETKSFQSNRRRMPLNLTLTRLKFLINF